MDKSVAVLLCFTSIEISVFDRDGCVKFIDNFIRQTQNDWTFDKKGDGGSRFMKNNNKNY